MPITTIDFETLPIEGGEKYPPEPRGVAVRTPNGKSTYYRGTPDQLRESLLPIWNGNDSILCHNASFDLAVALKHCKLPVPHPDRLEDTLWSLALHEPHAPNLQLKPSAERILGLPPTERDAVADWLIQHQPVPDVRITKKNAGAYVTWAPNALVAPYAIGDVDRTYKLHRALWPKVKHMAKAYRREARITPLLLEHEQRGIRVDAERLAIDCEQYTRLLAEKDDDIRKALKAPGLDIDSGQQLAEAIAKRFGIELPLTDKGNVRTDKATLASLALPPRLKIDLLYRSALAGDVRTFLTPWNRMSQASGGLIFTHWNQVRGASERKGSAGGARTLRLSSEPNFQNITSTEKREAFYALVMDLGFIPADYPLPQMRSYVVPFRKGHVLIGRDWSQQELRLLAHFENGPIEAQYITDPKMDIHAWVMRLIASVTGNEPRRKLVKILNFLTVYGGGLPALVAQSGMDEAEADQVRQAYFAALPSIRGLTNRIKGHAQAGRPIVTLGGREYFTEPPKVIGGSLRTFEYKLLNYLIQGSAADQMKELMARMWENGLSTAPEWLFYLTVHDETVLSVPKRHAKDALVWLGDLMEGIGRSLDRSMEVPFLSEGETGMNWAQMEEVL